MVRYDLEFLGLCPCLIDVEIINAKQGNSSNMISASEGECTCSKRVGAVRGRVLVLTCAGRAGVPPQGVGLTWH